MKALSPQQQAKGKAVYKEVHNGKAGIWGDDHKVSIEPVKTIGVFEGNDDNYSFYIPSDIAVDSDGNIYVLDSGNHRIQKYDADGRFLTTLGEEGQGPAEYKMPLSLDIDENNRLIVSDQGNIRIQVIDPQGRNLSTLSPEQAIGVLRVYSDGGMLMGGGGMLSGLLTSPEQTAQPDLIRHLNENGLMEKEFAKPLEYNDFMLNRRGNYFHFTIDQNDYTFIAFDFQNRIEKYSPSGELLLKIDRELNFSTTPPKPDKSNLDISGDRRSRRVMMRMPQMNLVSSGIAVDNMNRIWVLTARRQLKDEERINQNYNVNNDGSGSRAITVAVSGNTDLTKTDMFELEVYDSEGSLLGKIQLMHFADDIKIFGDRLYILDKYRGMNYYEYKIVEK
ncbi:MAG: 6-bladed beta-propeller [bacterium]|nr:6-bladed beta-propeller [bacterium]